MPLYSSVRPCSLWTLGTVWEKYAKLTYLGVWWLEAGCPDAVQDKLLELIGRIVKREMCLKSKVFSNWKHMEVCIETQVRRKASAVLARVDAHVRKKCQRLASVDGGRTCA